MKLIFEPIFLSKTKPQMTTFEQWLIDSNMDELNTDKIIYNLVDNNGNIVLPSSVDCLGCDNRKLVRTTVEQKDTDKIKYVLNLPLSSVDCLGCDNRKLVGITLEQKQMLNEIILK